MYSVECSNVKYLITINVSKMTSHCTRTLLAREKSQKAMVDVVS